MSLDIGLDVVDELHRYLISRMKIQISQKPAVKQVIRMSPINLKNPYEGAPQRLAIIVTSSGAKKKDERLGRTIQRKPYLCGLAPTPGR